MSDATKAVFLSYAREDTDAARRIAEALRSHGVEVWFDQNELRGGDAWDAKIRKQINDCTLFLPIISQHTQERGKGYFRLEWKLAVEQTHLLAEGIAFLAPVVIDDTTESAAVVPPEFMRVQWTRLAGALPTTQFVEQVKRLLDAPRRPTGGATYSRPAVAGVAGPGPTSASPATERRSPLWIAGVMIIMAIGAAVYFGLRPVAKETAASTPSNATAEAKPATTAPLVASDKSIAVLPFANMSPDQQNGFFADGVHEDVIINLTKIRELKVISITSVLAYRDPANRNLRKIAADLGVATVLVGSVRREGGRVRVTAQLIDTRTERNLWGDSYDRELTDVFSIQSALATDIATALRTTLTAGERTLIDRRPTTNQEAYDLFLRARARSGLGLGESETMHEVDKRVELYEQAVAKDPTFALAYAELAEINGGAYWDEKLDPTPERRERARLAAETAVHLAPDLPQARLALGEYYYRCLRDWSRALTEFRAAEAGIPNDPKLLTNLAFVSRRLGRWSEAIDYFGRSEAVDPLIRTTPAYRAETLVAVRRFPEVREECARALVRFPDSLELSALQAVAQYEIDGDRAAYLHRCETLPLELDDPLRLRAEYRLAMLKGDYEAADRALADPRLSGIPDGDAVIADPVALHRALVAFLRGQGESARRHADEAIAYYRSKQWAPRQESWVLMGIAQANAYAGRAADALREAPAALAREDGHDALTALLLRSELGRIYAALDRREEAIAILRTMMTGPSRTPPRDARHDPLWSRMNDDPRFEEILKSAKSL